MSGEVVANDSLAVKWFLGLAVDEPAPDHSSLTRFKEQLIEQGELQALLCLCPMALSPLIRGRTFSFFRSK